MLSMPSRPLTGAVAHRVAGRGEACLLRLRPLPHPRARWLAGRGEHFTTPSVLLVPTLVREIIILFGIYVLRFQYELLVHTPNTDVYRRILGCRFSNFAPYVANTLPRPSTLAHVVDVHQFIRSHRARTIYTALPLLLDFPKRRRANRKVNILEMPSARFIGERVVGAASFINKVFFFFSGTYAI